MEVMWNNPSGAVRCKILHGCQDTCKEYCYDLFFWRKIVYLLCYYDLCKLDAKLSHIYYY